MAIDIGGGATDRGSSGSWKDYTLLEKANPANATGTLDTIEIWSVDNLTGMKAGTFYGSGTSWTSRDVESIGNVTGGSKQTFSGLSCDVETDDLLGYFYSGGSGGTAVELDSSGGVGELYKSGDQFGAGTQTYTDLANYESSFYGTGTEGNGAEDFERSLSTAIGLSPTLSAQKNLLRTLSASIGLSATLSRVHGWVRSLSTAVGLSASLASVFGFGRVLSTAIGLSVSLSRTTTYGRSLTTAMGLAASLSRVAGYGRTLSTAIGLAAAMTSTTATFFVRTLSTAIGLYSKLGWTARMKRRLSTIGTNRVMRAARLFRWVSPASHNDPDSAWDDEANAYDDDTGTYAQTASPLSKFLELSPSENIECSKVRFNAKGFGTGNTIDLDIYYGGAWHDLYSGAYNDNEWIEKSFATQLVEKARVSFTAAIWAKAYLYEFDFWETKIDNRELTTPEENRELEDF